MPENDAIPFFTTPGFIQKFIPADDLQPFLKPGYGEFMIMRVEDMYQHVHRAVPPSRSTTHIIIYLTDGQADMQVDGQPYILHAGQMLTIAAGQIISFEAYHDAVYHKGFICIFDSPFLSGPAGQPDVFRQFEFFRVYSSPFISFAAGKQPDIVHLFTRLVTEFQLHGLRYQQLLQAYLLTLLLEIKAVYPPLPAGKHRAAVLIAEQFLEQLSQHIHQQHSVAAYAAMLNVSPNHLNKAVKTVTGKTPALWIDETIILEAKVLLAQTGSGVAQVAAALGILDASYFARLFKKKTGVTPGDYRKKIEMC